MAVASCTARPPPNTPPLLQTLEGQAESSKPLLCKLHTRGPHVSGAKSGRKACRETEKQESPQQSSNSRKKKRTRKTEGNSRVAGVQRASRKQLGPGGEEEEEEGCPVIGKADKLTGWRLLLTWSAKAWCCSSPAAQSQFVCSTVGLSARRSKERARVETGRKQETEEQPW